MPPRACAAICRLALPVVLPPAALLSVWSCHLGCCTHQAVPVGGVFAVERRHQSGDGLPAAVEVERHQVDEVEVLVERLHVVGLSDDVVVRRDGRRQTQPTVLGVERGAEVLPNAVEVSDSGDRGCSAHWTVIKGIEESCVT